MSGQTGPASRPGPLPRWRDRLLLALVSGLSLAFERLPIDRVVALGGLVGGAWYWSRAPRTRRVRDQLTLAFPEIARDRLEIWTRDVFVHLGRGLAELVLLRGTHRNALLERVRVEGLDHLAAAERATTSGGVLIVTAHCGNWELGCARVAAMGIPISVVYRSLRQPGLDQALLGLRRSGGVDQIPMGRAGIRVVRALEAGRKVVVLLDQDARREEGLFVSFFGRPASTRYGPLALAALRGFPVVPVFIHREPDGRTHRFRIQPALQLETGASDDLDVLGRNVQRLTVEIEKEIRAFPSQWIWTHRRWRTQPEAFTDAVQT